jgi:hypothetical protein
MLPAMIAPGFGGIGSRKTIEGAKNPPFRLAGSWLATATN